MASSVALLLPLSLAFIQSIAAVPSLSWRTARHDPVPRQGGMRGPVKWLINDDLVLHEHNDPFHILLLDATYAKNDRITIKYVATSWAYVLLMPYDEAMELAAHAESDGLVCRVMPFCEGGTGLSVGDVFVSWVIL
ncbi:hypothetical protein ACHAW5_009454 [Stephanodiscus triporus]|uniref:Uncharacterized protein n=1 Tax=Stephanodiscus triporus TaxID=2934178 RepID=A0ABD3NFT4_9STRA